MRKKNILILLESISEYRVPIYNIISNHHELTIAFYKNDNTKSVCNFRKIRLCAFRWGTIVWIKGKFRKLCKKMMSLFLLLIYIICHIVYFHFFPINIKLSHGRLV